MVLSKQIFAMLQRLFSLFKGSASRSYSRMTVGRITICAWNSGTRSALSQPLPFAGICFRADPWVCFRDPTSISGIVVGSSILAWASKKGARCPLSKSQMTFIQLGELFRRCLLAGVRTLTSDRFALGLVYCRDCLGTRKSLANDLPLGLAVLLGIRHR